MNILPLFLYSALLLVCIEGAILPKMAKQAKQRLFESVNLLEKQTQEAVKILKALVQQAAQIERCKEQLTNLDYKMDVSPISIPIKRVVRSLPETWDTFDSRMQPTDDLLTNMLLSLADNVLSIGNTGLRIKRDTEDLNSQCQQFLKQIVDYNKETTHCRQGWRECESRANISKHNLLRASANQEKCRNETELVVQQLAQCERRKNANLIHSNKALETAAHQYDNRIAEVKKECNEKIEHTIHQGEKKLQELEAALVTNYTEKEESIKKECQTNLTSLTESCENFTISLTEQIHNKTQQEVELLTRIAILEKEASLLNSTAPLPPSTTSDDLLMTSTTSGVTSVTSFLSSIESVSEVESTPIPEVMSFSPPTATRDEDVT